MTDYIANNVWHLEEQAKRLQQAGEAMLREAASLTKTAATIQRLNRERLGMVQPPQDGAKNE